MPKAAPTTTATARSTTFPRSKNARKPVSISPSSLHRGNIPDLRDLAAANPHERHHTPDLPPRAAVIAGDAHRRPVPIHQHIICVGLDAGMDRKQPGPCRLDPGTSPWLSGWSGVVRHVERQQAIERIEIPRVERIVERAHQLARTRLLLCPLTALRADAPNIHGMVLKLVHHVVCHLAQA